MHIVSDESYWFRLFFLAGLKMGPVRAAPKRVRKMDSETLKLAGFCLLAFGPHNLDRTRAVMANVM